jgi:hypothetical protein
LEERYSRGGCSPSAEDGSPAAIPQRAIWLSRS